MIIKTILYLFIISLFTSLSANALITTIPTFKKYQYDKQKAILGQKLFNDTRLSKNDTISCASCHLLTQGGDDNLIGSYGIYGQFISRNSPTIFNATFNKSQHWDASSSTLEAQAKISIMKNTSMNSNFKDIIYKLKQDSKYVISFSKIYKNGITEENILNAIVQFEKALITPNSKFDKYLNGDKNILTQKELNGYKLFKEYGCISCHNGINIGGNLIQKIGIINQYKTKDVGRFSITNNIDDIYYFKVPSLRNVALTAPYFHDGKIDTLQEAVKQMSILQVGYPIDVDEIDDIVEFLKSLTGDIPQILQKDR
jgi:cytochrome c peroxidase